MTSSAVVFGVKVGVKIYITKQYKTTNKKLEKAEGSEKESNTGLSGGTGMRSAPDRLCDGKTAY